MRLTIELTTEESIALRRFYAANQPPTPEEAAALALREYLISTGDFEIAPALEVDGDVSGRVERHRAARGKSELERNPDKATERRSCRLKKHSSPTQTVSPSSVRASIPQFRC